jgi:hypothetical protein
VDKKNRLVTAKTEGYVVTLWEKKDKILKILPDDFELCPLGPQNSKDESLHPITLCLFNHFNLTSYSHNMGFRLCRSYNEAVYSISAVKLKNCQLEGSFITDIKLNSMVAKLSGWFYGFPKQMAEFRLSDHQIDIHSKKNLNTSLVKGRFFDEGIRKSEKEDIQNLITYGGRYFVKTPFSSSYKYLEQDWKLESYDQFSSVKFELDLAHEDKKIIGGEYTDEDPLQDLALKISTDWTMTAPLRIS